MSEWLLACRIGLCKEEDTGRLEQHGMDGVQAGQADFSSGRVLDVLEAAQQVGDPA